jgi:oligogalacturonide lyase
MRMTRTLCCTALVLCASLPVASTASAQIGRRLPSEKRIVPDPVTGIPLTFLTSTPAGDFKIYPTHPQWTSDGKWLIFRSSRAAGQAMAVNEETGDMVQVTGAGYTGMLCVARRTMKLYVMRDPTDGAGRGGGAASTPGGIARSRCSWRRARPPAPPAPDRRGRPCEALR